jgi:hypothetical protein
VPTRPTAPTAAYRLPTVEVIAVASPRITVRLADGTEVTTDERNVRRERPAPPERNPKQQARPSVPDGYAEVTLW